MRSFLFVAITALMATTAQAESSPMPMHDHAAMMKADSKESASTTAYREGMATMHRDMDITYTGDADLDFVNGMIPHHEGAVAMAKTLLRYGTDPELKKLGQAVIAAQAEEIKFMQAWRIKHTTVKEQ